jgi:predicted RNA binding protein YcfA (HicA-like mRNA interferase family)
VPLKPLPFHEVKRKLEAAGFTEYSQKGSHIKFIKQTDSGTLTVIVPQHREIAIGTSRSILRQAALSADEFEAL